MKILIIDDNGNLRKAIAKMLRHEGFSPIEATGGAEGLLLASESAPDLVLTDVAMPGLDGYGVCRAIKKSGPLSHLPVIIMSGEMVEEKDIVSGLDGGADDYLIKPFGMTVLLSRIRAVLRRYRPSPDGRKCLKARGITLDPASREVRVSGMKISLTRKEFDLLALLIDKAGRVMTTSYLLETIWGYDTTEWHDPHTVESHLSRLRVKLGSSVARSIVNVRGVGYRFEK